MNAALSSRACSILRFDGAREGAFDDEVACEEPLEIRLRDSRTLEGPARPLTVTMRTPGHDRELAAGFLVSEGIVARRSDLESLVAPADEPCERAGNVVSVALARGVSPPSLSLDRHFFATSSCGVCGKASIEALQALLPPRSGRVDRDTIRPTSDVLLSLPGKLREAQPGFDRTGGLHATALFDEHGSLLRLHEDVGRHNAFDKVVGASFLAGDLPLSRAMVLVSGRASFELVQKALMAGIPVVVAIGAPSSLAVELARERGITLVGFVRNDRFNVYSGGERIVFPRGGAG